MQWDEYWSEKGNNKIYGFLAQIYRKFIFKRLLNHYSYKYFSQNGLYLHGGCGSGQVDEDVAKKYEIVAMDISKKALELYRTNNPASHKITRGSVFQLPFRDATFDGVYNLGVMEHFEMEEILQALTEFRRVLKKGGVLLLFWPPEFGSSVIFLKIFHAVAHRFYRKDFSLHPAEVSRLKSKKEARMLLESAGFKVDKVCFNIRDLFTLMVLVAKRS